MKAKKNENGNSKVVNIPNGKEKWKALAAQPNSRVIICNAPETYAMTDLARYSDMGLNLLRKRIMVTISPEEALPMMDEFNKQMIELERVVSEICKKVNVRYRRPKNINNIRKQMGLSVDGEENVSSATETPAAKGEKAESAKKTASDKKAA